MRKRSQGTRVPPHETGEPDEELRPLSPAGSAMLHNLCDVFAALGALLPEVREITPALDLAAEESREGRLIARGLRDAARLVLRQAAGEDDGRLAEAMEGATVGGDGNGARDQLGLAGVLPAPDASLPALSDADETAAYLALAGLVAEVGYDEHTARVLPVPMPDDTFALSWRDVSREAADIALMERVMARLELWASREDIGVLEREASRYCFDRFSAPSRGDERTFPRDVREQEFTFLARPFVSLGDTVAHDYQRARGRTLPPGPRRVLRALVRSRSSLFVVRRREGTSVSMEDKLDGKTYAVTEHNDSLVYAPGSAAFGRLLPLGSGKYLRSPGMAFGEWPNIETRGPRMLAGGGQIGMPTELLIEGILATAEGHAIPRRIRPAPSRVAAEELLFDFSIAMRDAGLAREVAPGDAPPELRAFDAKPGQSVLNIEVDQVLADWFQALSEQARVGVAPSPSRGGGSKRRKKKRGR
jgi:hypothetical protein